MIIDVKIQVEIDKTKNHEYQPTERIPERASTHMWQSQIEIEYYSVCIF